MKTRRLINSQLMQLFGAGTMHGNHVRDSGASLSDSHLNTSHTVVGMSQEQKNLYGRVLKVAGPLVVADHMSGAGMYELVRVGHFKLIGHT